MADYRVEECRESNRIFVAAHNCQVEIQVLNDGIEVQITKGNEVISECGYEKE